MGRRKGLGGTWPVSTRPTCVELFCGAGGLALGMEQAGFDHQSLHDKDRDCIATIKANRPWWNAQASDVASMTMLAGECDALAGGFPCQPFSRVGLERGFADAKGTAFFHMCERIEECRPSLVLLENVHGLIGNDGGRTVRTVLKCLRHLGLRNISMRVLNANEHGVPQNRMRLFIAAGRLAGGFPWPKPLSWRPAVGDALLGGSLYRDDCPPSDGTLYPERKRAMMELVPEGGNWRDLTEAQRLEHLPKQWLDKSPGGCSGVAKRLSMAEPSYTITTYPVGQLTMRCHPWETRPLRIRECARLQTFPDDWEFKGSRTSQYRQIGNAVPVALARRVGKAALRYLGG